jgi:hypothetical protein
MSKCVKIKLLQFKKMHTSFFSLQFVQLFGSSRGENGLFQGRPIASRHLLQPQQTQQTQLQRFARLNKNKQIKQNNKTTILRIVTALALDAVWTGIWALSPRRAGMTTPAIVSRTTQMSTRMLITTEATTPLMLWVPNTIQLTYEENTTAENTHT